MLLEDLVDARPGGELAHGDVALLVDHGRRALIRHFAGVIGWRGRPPTRHAREARLREAAVGDGRLVNAMLLWDVRLRTLLVAAPNR